MRKDKTSDQYVYGTIIARLMAERMCEEEGKKLEEWISEKEENLILFENLINQWKWRWAKKWFRENGVSTKGIKWKNLDGWHKPDRKSLIDFYIVMFFMFLVLAGVYFLLEM